MPLAPTRPIGAYTPVARAAGQPLAEVVSSTV